jgi:hypothetical protein
MVSPDRKQIKNKSACFCRCFFWVFYACCLKYYHSKTLKSLSCSLNAVFPGLKMWDTFAFDCFDFKVRPGTPGLTNNPGLHRQSNLKSPQTTCYCNFFNSTIQCNCSACNVPPDAGLQKNRKTEKPRSGQSSYEFCICAI